jgi:VWFA-related protein
MRKPLLPLLIIVMCAGGPGGAQQPPRDSSAGQAPAVTFRAQIDSVEIDAVVTDERGAFVRGLTRDDFEIFEDGKKQTPTLFSLVDLPIGRPTTPSYSTQPVESDVRSTMRNFDGRLYVFVLDDLHTNVTRSPLVRDAARRFVQQYLGAGDLAAVVYTSGREDAAQELTGSQSRLLAAIDKFLGRKLPSASAERLAAHLNGVSLGTQQSLQDAQRTADPDDFERGYNARRTLNLIESVANWMTDIHGRRKALVLFGEGIDYDIYDVFNNSSASTIVSYARTAVAAAQRANVNIYAVDPRGLTLLGDEAIEISSPSPYPQVDFGTTGGFQKELLLAQESLISLAQETGGMAVVNTNDVAGGLGRIALDNSRYYLLGYNSDPTRSPGKFRKIEVRLRRPGLQVRARRGYLPPDSKAAARAEQLQAKAGTSSALRAALNNPLPLGDLPLRVFAAPFKGTGKNASVLLAVEIEGQALKFDQENGRFNENVEVSIVAVDTHAKVQGGTRQNFELKLLPKTHDFITRAGVRLLSRLDLPPARYQIRVGAHESVGGATGTVPYDIEVPDYSRDSFGLSGVVLTSSRAQEFATPQPDKGLADVFSSPPTATRAFTSDEEIAYFVELYDNSSEAAHKVDVVTTVRSAADGRTVFTASDNREIKAESSEKRPIHGFSTDFTLADYTQGTYILRIEATSTANRQTAFREIPFEVVEGSAAPAR